MAANPRQGKKKGQKKSRTARAVICRCPNNVPDEIWLVFTYSDMINASAAANLYVYQWNLNSPFDPNRTAAGAQPPAWAEWTALYGYYTCTKTEFDYEVFNRTAGSTAAVAACALPNGTAVSDFFDCSAQRRAVKAFTQYGAPPARVRGVVDVSTVWGVPPERVLADDEFQALMTASPNFLSVLNIAVQTAGATDTLTITGSLRQTVRLYRPDTFNLSATRKKRAESLKNVSPGPARISGPPCTVTQGRPGPAATAAPERAVRESPCHCAEGQLCWRAHVAE
jgi:hypothetical protein